MRKLILAIVAVAVVTTAWSTSHLSPQRQKARHYLMQGYLKEADNNTSDEAYELYKKAFDTDSTYEEAAFAYSLSKIILLSTSPDYSGDCEDELRRMRAYVDKYPGDIEEANDYANAQAYFRNYDEVIRIFKRNAELNPSKTHILLQLADVYTDADMIDSALYTLNRYQAIEGSSRNLINLKVYYHTAMNDTAGAFAEVNDILKEFPNDPDYNLIKGLLFESIEMNDSAMVYYQKAEKANPSGGEIKLVIGNLYHKMGDDQTYNQKLYDALLCEDLEMEDKITILADYLQVLISNESDTAPGDYLFQTLANQYPHEPEVLNLSARYSLAKEDYAAALDAASYALDLDPSDPNLWRLKLRALMMLENYDDAYNLYLESKKQLGPNVDVGEAYLTTAMVGEQYDRALTTAKELITIILPDIDPDTCKAAELPEMQHLGITEIVTLSNLYTVIGDIYSQLDEKERRTFAYENAIALNPYNDSALNNLAYFMSNEGGDLHKALEMVESANNIYRDNPTYLDTKAWVLYRLERYPEALEVQRKARDIAEQRGIEDDELYMHLGEILLKNNLPKQAAEAFEKANELKDKSK